MTRKAVTAIINGSLYIDPNDASKEKIEAIKEKVFKLIGKDINVIIAPIKEWMPSSGTEALMKEAIRNAGGFAPIVSKKEIKRAFNA